MKKSRPCIPVRTIVWVAIDVVNFLSLAFRSHAELAAENLFLRKQLALYLERQGALAHDAVTYRVSGRETAI
jgi:hypothetical protein